jgi:hypothetical protein
MLPVHTGAALCFNHRHSRMATPSLSWLFVLGDESIWIVHGEAGATFVYGPGALQQCFQFATDAARDAYQVSMAERLLGDGWVLWAGDRREGRERRGAPRAATDRRGAPMKPASSGGNQS